MRERSSVTTVWCEQSSVTADWCEQQSSGTTAMMQREPLHVTLETTSTGGAVTRHCI